MGAISIVTELPGPRSRALGEERRRWVSAGVSAPRHGLFFESAHGARLTDVDGNVFLDLTGGIGCMNADTRRRASSHARRSNWRACNTPAS